MSLGDWLNSTIGEAPPRYNSPNARPRDQERPLTPRAALPQRDAADVVEIHALALTSMQKCMEWRWPNSARCGREADEHDRPR